MALKTTEKRKHLAIPAILLLAGACFLLAAAGVAGPANATSDQDPAGAEGGPPARALTVTTVRPLTFGDFRYHRSSEAGSAFYGLADGDVSLTDAGGGQFACEMGAEIRENGETTEVDQRGVVQPGLVVVNGEPHSLVRILFGGSNVDVSGNIIKLRSRSDQVRLRVRNDLTMTRGVAIRGATHEPGRDLKNTQGTVWRTDRNGNIAVCIGGVLDLPYAPDLEDGDYSAQINIEFEYAY